MIRILPVAVCAAILVARVSSSTPQDQIRECKQSALAAWKPVPKLRYPCGNAANDYDEKILKLPARRRALATLQQQLALLNTNSWWQTSPDDLSVCDFKRKSGKLSAQEDERYSTSYIKLLFGDNHIRLVLLPDPCFQTQYSGSNGFILNRKGAQVFVTQVLDGFFSRAEDAVDIDFAKLDGEEIIEISTGTGGLHPQLTNYYFTINSKTNRAVPKNLFLGDSGPTNEISSALLMSDPEDFNLPADAVSMKVIDKGSLVMSFSIYSEDNGPIDDNGRKLTRRELKWDGKVYR